MGTVQVAPVALTATGIEYHIADKILLSGVDLSIHDGDRIGLIGRNGAGKTTLLKLLAGAEPPYGGEIIKRRHLTTGYLSQSVHLQPNRTVKQIILDGALELVKARREFESANISPERHHELEVFINAHDAWNLEAKVAALADILEVPQLDREITTLSGGEQRRVMLCNVLISQPDLLILDEPTNHLDIASIEWLEQLLNSYSGSCVVVTHDRYFLDNVTTRTFELSAAKLEAYTGNYTDYLQAKETRLQISESREQKRQSFLKRELEWLRRGPKARGTKAQYRIKRFHEVAGQRGPEQETDVELILPPAGYQNDIVLETVNLGMTIGGKMLFSNLNLRMAPGTKYAVVGRNGVGKTTLLRLILGEIEPTEGCLKTGTQTHMNYIDQRRLQLDNEKTLYDEIGEGKEFVNLGDKSVSVHTYLNRFLFDDGAIYSKVGALSGGERSRLLLAKQLKHGGNLLLLDEPTNDLDLPTLRVLEEALANFDGCVLVVSHDRYFVNRICTHVLAIEDDGQITVMPGDYDYYTQKRIERQKKLRVASPAPKSSSPVTSTSATAANGIVRKLKWKEERELEEMEKNINAAEAEVKRLEDIFSAVDFYEKHGEDVKELTAALEASRRKVEELYIRWEELEEIKSASE